MCDPNHNHPPKKVLRIVFFGKEEDGKKPILTVSRGCPVTIPATVIKREETKGGQNEGMHGRKNGIMEVMEGREERRTEERAGYIYIYIYI
jgi:hypothetical protein